jgi:hypothetical protein
MAEIDQATVLKAAEFFKQWMFTAGGDTHTLLPATEFVEGMDNRYGLKNMKVNEWLRWIDGRPGVDLGFGAESPRWIVSRCVESTEPIRYGETIAIGFGTQPTWVNHEKQTVGPNVGFQSNPSCEWRIYGGPFGTPVEPNKLVALFNEKYMASENVKGEFVIYFPREVGAEIGTPTSEKAWDQLKELFEDIGDVIKAVAEVLDLYESVTESDEQPTPGEPGAVSG